MIKRKRLSWENNYFIEKDHFVIAQNIKYFCHENYNKNLPRMKVVWSLQVWVTVLIGRKLWRWTCSKSIGKNRLTHPRRGSSCIYKRKYSHYVRMHFYFLLIQPETFSGACSRSHIYVRYLQSSQNLSEFHRTTTTTVTDTIYNR